jgi:hypothetical protein
MTENDIAKIPVNTNIALIKHGSMTAKKKIIYDFLKLCGLKLCGHRVFA